MPESIKDDDAIDGLLRAAMKTLDDDVPSGYFEALPNRTLARLEGSMQTTSGSSDTDLPLTTNPPAEPKERDEDSGLHDIRNLASSARMRLSSRRIGTNPPPVEEDVLAASSGSWKNVALPEPAKMVALPALDELPSKQDIKAAQKAEKAAAKEAKSRQKERSSRPSGEINATPLIAQPGVENVSPSALPSIAKVSDAPLHLEEDIPSLSTGTAKGATTAAVGTAKGAVVPMIGSRIAGAGQKKSNKGVLLGTLGVGLAAAAGVIIYMQTNKGGSDTSTASAPPPAAELAKQAPAVTPIAKGEDLKAEPAKPDDKGDAAAGSAAATEPAVPTDPPKVPTKGLTVKKPDKKTEKQIIDVKDPGNGIAPKKEEKKPEPPPANTKKDGEPSIDELLKGQDMGPKKDDKPKLEKKSLTGADFKNGIGAIAGKAQACYGLLKKEGRADVKLTIAPSGQVSKVTVTGVFVGTPVAGCVEAAVKSASFPAWDGGPASFGYTFLLSE